MPPCARPWKFAPIIHPAKALLYTSFVAALCGIEWSLRVYKLLPTILVVSISMQILAVVSIPTYVFTMRAVNRRRKELGMEDHQFMSLPSRWGPITTMAVAIAWWLGID